MVRDVWLTHTTDSDLWDWDFGLHDIHSVGGDDALITAIIHAVLLRKNELKQVLYEDRGSTIHDYTPQPLRSVECEMVAEALKITVTQIQGINDALVTIIQDHDDMSITADVTVLTTDGKEIEVNGI